MSESFILVRNKTDGELKKHTHILLYIFHNEENNKNYSMQGSKYLIQITASIKLLRYNKKTHVNKNPVIELCYTLTDLHSTDSAVYQQNYLFTQQRAVKMYSQTIRR